MADLSALKAIIRLKAGLSPSDRVEDVTIDLRRHSAQIKLVLGENGRGHDRFAVVLGQYGSGKTHFLQLAKRAALSAGFGVAHLNLDTGLGCLGQPQRHVQSLLMSLTAPGGHGNVLDWFGTALEDREKLKDFDEALKCLGTDCPWVSSIARFGLRDLPEAQRLRFLFDFLSGSFLVGKTAAASTRLHAYELVSFWSKFCIRFFGCRGIVLLIDELENLFSNAVYWSILSRRAAYRALSYYTEGLDSAVVLAALTPPGWDLLRSEVAGGRSGVLADVAQNASENVAGLYSRILRTTPYEVARFGSREYAALFERLAALHGEARSYPKWWLNGHVLAPKCGPEMTPRIFAKAVVSGLERVWFTRTHC